MTSKPLCIIPHMGLGDHIICAAIVAKYASERDHVYLPTFAHNEVSVKSFYVNHPNVSVFTVESDKDIEENARLFQKIGFDVLRLGYYGMNEPGYIPMGNYSFDEWFYVQAGMDIKDRVRWCPLAKAAGSVDQHKHFEGLDYVFCHQDPERGFIVDVAEENDIVQLCPNPDKTKSILRYADAILKAKKAHCIDSSFLHLCESLPTTGKLFWHQYARAYREPENKLKLQKEWTIIQ